MNQEKQYRIARYEIPSLVGNSRHELNERFESGRRTVPIVMVYDHEEGWVVTERSQRRIAIGMTYNQDVVEEVRELRKLGYELWDPKDNAI